MDKVVNRKGEQTSLSFSKSHRFIDSEIGIFYKVRGGKLNGPFKTVADARSDLAVFLRILSIEAQLDPRSPGFLSKSRR